MSLRQVRMSERKNEAEIKLLNTQADALEAEAGKNKEETTSIIEKRLWEVKQEMFKDGKASSIRLTNYGTNGKMAAYRENDNRRQGS